MELKTKRLRIIPLTTEQFKLLIDGIDKLDASLGLSPCNTPLEEHTQSAMEGLYKLCIENPEKQIWYTNWQIIYKKENKAIGSACFMNAPNENYEVEVGYGINEEYRKNGYMTEALRAIVDWAFSQKGVYYVQAQTDEENCASKKVLEKCKFKQIGNDDEGLIWEKQKHSSSWLSLCMCLGLSIGIIIGMINNNATLGMCIGIAIGIAIGDSLDAVNRNKRKRNK